MKKQKKKKTVKRRRERPTRNSNEESSWVDQVVLEPLLESVDNDLPSLSLVSWNVLAEGYCSRRSHPGLPQQYAREVFNRPRRRHRILQILEQFDVDVLCLQEVDLDEIGQSLSQLRYEGLETPRSKGGGIGRIDACGIYVQTERWTVLDHELIELDDIATLSVQNDDNDNDTSLNGMKSAASNLQGLQQSFLRRKTALLVRLEHVASGQTIVVANGHLYWHPGYEYVKLCQVHYILQCAKRFVNANEPFVFCGDLNSRPHGVAHSYLTHGFINAKRVAPWYAKTNPDEETIEEEEMLVNGMTRLQLKDHPDETLQVRYILDATLNKLCRWLRILGIDTALETDDEEKQRTNNSEMILFQRAGEEKRTLITTSTKLMRRRDCPAGAYCISPTVLPTLEVAMVHMLLTHGVVLEPITFLSRCVVCNGNIIELQGKHESRRVLEKYEAPLDLMDDDCFEVYECDNCRQGYWWCDRPTSPASRVKNTATRLFQVCVRAGVPFRGELPDMLKSINVEEERQRGWDFDEKGSELLRQKLDVVDWLKDEHLACPFELESAYAFKDDSGSVIGELLPFTNVMNGFVNTLDYIFYDKKKFKLSERLHVPKSFAELNRNNIEKGHLIPSDVWPSDHLAIGARLTFSSKVTASESIQERDAVPAVSYEAIARSPSTSAAPADNNETANDDLVAGTFCLPASSGQPPPPPPPPTTNQHGQRCDCGCVPNILSMFEMAELRKQARLKKKQEQEQAEAS